MLFFNCFFFFWKKYDLMHFERHFAFQNALNIPEKYDLMHFERHFAFQNALNYIFSKNTEKNLCFTSKFRKGLVTLKTQFFLFGLI